MNYAILLLDWLRGKKTTIVSLISLLAAYASFKGIIGNDELVLFNSALVILGLSANFATTKFFPLSK